MIGANSLGDPFHVNYRPQRSWAKVIFSQACVKNSVHRGGGLVGVCLSACWDTPPDQAPPRDQADPPLDGGTPPGWRTPPGTRQTPPDAGWRNPPGTRQTPLDGGPPGTRQTPPDGGTPPDQADPPFGKQTPAYGLRAAGTHPTGMHSCCKLRAIFRYNLWI